MSMINEEIQRGVKAHLEGNLNGAELAYQSALEIDSNNATVHNNLGFVYGQQQRWSEAITHLKTALDLKPDMAMAHTNLGQVLVAQGEIEQGLRHLNKAVEIDPRNCQAWDNLARIRLQAGDHQGAEYAWMRALGMAPGDSRLLTCLGTAIASQKRFGEAITVLQQAIESNIDNNDAWAQLGVIHFLQNNLGNARAALQRAVEINPNDTTALRHLGLIELANKQHQVAIAAFSRVVELAPSDDVTRMDLAVILISQHRADEAMVHLDDMYARCADDEKVLYYRALALRQCSEILRGDDLLKRVVEMNGKYAGKAQQILSAS